MDPKKPGYETLPDRPGKRIYRIPSYSSRPWAVYEGTKYLGSFHSLEQIKELHPEAVLKSKKITRL